MTDLKATVKFWHNSATKTLEEAEILYRFKRYDSCLFFCHLALEKLLKALVVESTQKAAPYIHDLNELANRASITFPNETLKQIADINTFNIAGRYDSPKLQFYKLCTKPYTTKYLNITKKIFLWLEKKFQKK